MTLSGTFRYTPVPALNSRSPDGVDTRVSPDEAPATVTPPPTVRRWMLVSCGGQLLALPASDVREVVPSRPFTRIPGAPVFVSGLVNLRGRMVTVVDLGARLRLAPAAASATHRLVVLTHGDRDVGLAVDDVLRIVALADDELAPLEDETLPFLSAEGELEARRFRTLDTAALLHPVFG